MQLLQEEVALLCVILMMILSLLDPSPFLPRQSEARLARRRPPLPPLRFLPPARPVVEDTADRLLSMTHHQPQQQPELLMLVVPPRSSSGGEKLTVLSKRASLLEHFY